MTTTLAATVTNLRRLLHDEPAEDYITVSVDSTTATTITVATSSLWAAGQVWEFDDGDATSAEQILVRSVNPSTGVMTIKRAHGGSTAATHATSAVVLQSPRFLYDTVAQAVNQTLDVDLYPNDLVDIVEHQVTSSATTNTYNKPSSSCERPLNVYQRINSTDAPTYLRNFSRRYLNADTTLWSNGGYFNINENLGAAGTDIYYVSCAHKLAIGTVSASQERLVHMRSAYYLLTWAGIRRLAGPTNQSDRSTQPLDTTRLAAFYEQEWERLLRGEAAYLREQLADTLKVFRREPI